MERRNRLLAVLCTCLLALVLPGVAGAAEIVDRSVASPQLSVNSRNVALVSYSVHGVSRHVLYWGGVDWAPSFKRDYSGGWKSKIADYKRFSNSCKPYTGPRLALVVSACDAPDGSHWALQQWSRLWKNYGGDSAPAELYISHWRGDIGELEIQTDYSYHGKHQHLWGSFTFHNKPVYGNKWTAQGVPKDKQGRNIYVDFLKGPTWSRVNSFLTHPPTAGFCYTFADHPASSPAWNGQGTGDAYRATAIGPGVSPLVETHFTPPLPYSAESDDAANAAQRELLGNDHRCRID
ncbi:MAG: hypothetical protein QOH00_3133 [Gaiellales bacterium]|jgi:hypothetical protein|nr:hypothetical protein [Gaiellales bacterium]